MADVPPVFPGAPVFPSAPAPPAGFTDCFVAEAGAAEARAAGAATLWVAAETRPDPGPGPQPGGGSGAAIAPAPGGDRWIAPAGAEAKPDAWVMTPKATPPADDRPLFIAGTARADRIARILDARPGPVVLRHLNSAPGDLDALQAALALAEDRPGLWLDTSGAIIGIFVAEAVRRIPDRVVFASGAPDLDPIAQAGHVAAALPPDAARAVFVDNPARLARGR